MKTENELRLDLLAELILKTSKPAETIFGFSIGSSPYMPSGFALICDPGKPELATLIKITQPKHAQDA